MAKPLAASWAMPEQATFSIDGKTWLHTEKGTRKTISMIYTIKPEAASVLGRVGTALHAERGDGFSCER